MRLLVILLGLLFTLSACQTAPTRQFAKIKNGMEKHEVIDLMGGPWTTTRLHGKDRWIYVFYDNDVRLEREVHFLNGSVVYAGDQWKPAPEKTAEAKDKNAEKLDKEFKEESVRIKQENKEAYSNYEKEVRGEGKKVKFMPDYEEIQ